MSKIKVNTVKVRDDSSSLRSNCNNMSNIADGIRTLCYSVDGKIQARRNIGSRLHSENNGSKGVQNQLQDIQKFIEEAMDRYERTENKVQKEGEALEMLYATCMGAGSELKTVENIVESHIEEYAKMFLDIDESSDDEIEDTKLKKTGKEEKEESYLDKALSLAEVGINTAKEGMKKIEDAGVDKVKKLTEEAEALVEKEFSNFEGEVKNIEGVINNKSVQDIELKTAELFAIWGQEWNSNDPSELAKLPTLEAQCEDNIKSDASDMWKLYAKEDPEGAKTITNAINDVEIAKNQVDAAWELYKKEDPVHAGEAAGAWDFVKDTVGGVLGLAHGVGVQYYDLREDPIQTLKNWARFGMDVEGLVNPLMPETADDKVIISSIGKEIDKDLIHGDAYTRSKFGTEAILNIATLWDGAGEVSAAGKVGEASSDLSKVVEVSTKVEDASKGISEVSAEKKAVEELQVANKNINSAANIGQESETILRAQDKIGLDSKGVESINTPSASEVAVPRSEPIIPKPEEVLVGSAAVNEGKVESAVNALDKTGEDIKIKNVDEAEVDSGKGDTTGVGEAVEGGFTSLNSKYVFKDSEIANQIQDISSQASIDRMKAFNNSLDTLLKEYSMTLDEFELLSSKPISELNESELKTIYEIRNSYEMPENSTLMSKVIPDETFKNCINNGEYSKTVVGCVAKAQDTSGLKTYNDYFNTFGLGYDGSPYKNPAKDSMYVMRFTTDNNVNIKIPFGGTTDGELQKFSKTSDIDIDDLTKMDSPFQGNGFTKNEIGGLGSPEYTVSRSAPVELNDYSAIYKVDRSGNETLEAIYFDQNWYVVK